MLKFLLLIFILSYAVYRVGGFIFKILSLGGNTNPQTTRRQTQSRRPNGSNVEIDYIPEEKKGKGPYKGGDYVDYEEVS